MENSKVVEDIINILSELILNYISKNKEVVNQIQE